MRTAKLTLLLTLSACVWAQSAATSKKEIESVYPEAHAFYLDLHQNPELSSHEAQTAAKLAGRLRSLGYDVTEHVGGTGIVAILKNGNGPTVMLRTRTRCASCGRKDGAALRQQGAYER
jgi:hippurate hydrolase